SSFFASKVASIPARRRELWAFANSINCGAVSLSALHASGAINPTNRKRTQFFMRPSYTEGRSPSGWKSVSHNENGCPIQAPRGPRERGPCSWGGRGWESTNANRPKFVLKGRAHGRGHGGLNRVHGHPFGKSSPRSYSDHVALIASSMRQHFRSDRSGLQ